MISAYIALSLAIGLHEAIAQHRELTKDGASSRSAVVNAAMFGVFVTVLWPFFVVFFLCARGARLGVGS